MRESQAIGFWDVSVQTKSGSHSNFVRDKGKDIQGLSCKKAIQCDNRGKIYEIPVQ